MTLISLNTFPWQGLRVHFLIISDLFSLLGVDVSLTNGYFLFRSDLLRLLVYIAADE